MDRIKTWCWDRFKEVTVISFILTCLLMLLPGDILVHIRPLFLIIIVLSIGFSVSYWVLKQDQWSESKRTTLHFSVLYFFYMIGGCTAYITLNSSAKGNGLLLLAWMSVGFVVFDYWCILGVQSLLLRREVNDFNGKFTNLKNRWEM